MEGAVPRCLRWLRRYKRLALQNQYAALTRNFQPRGKKYACRGRLPCRPESSRRARCLYRRNWYWMPRPARGGTNQSKLISKIKQTALSAEFRSGACYSCLYLSICGSICAREAVQNSLLRMSMPKRAARSAAEASPVLASSAL